MKNFINLGFLVIILCICAGLFIEAVAPSEKIFFVILLLLALFINKRQKYIIISYSILFSTIMIYYSATQIPGWSSRTSYVGTDSIWGRNNGFADILIYTLINDKKCIIEADCWYYDYISVLSDEIVSDYELITDQNFFSELREEYQQVGWMHIDADFQLINDSALECLRGEKLVYLYVNPTGLSNADTVIILNDEEGNIYIGSENEWKKE